MTTEILVSIFYILFFIHNLFYLSFIEKVFEIKSKKSKLVLFSFITGIVGTCMLVLIGSMSALGYGIMLIVYMVTVMLFYKGQSVATRMACVLLFNIHIMAVRAIIAAVMSWATGTSIYELSQNENTFWLILIMTPVFCACITVFIARVVPEKYLHALNEKTEYLYLYIATAILANIYMISNGNVYIHEINYALLPLHQIIASITWLLATYVGVVTLGVMTAMRERREALEKDNQYQQVLASRVLAVLEVNCTQDRLLRILHYGEQEPVPTLSYTEYIELWTNELIDPDQIDTYLKHESPNMLLEFFEQGETEIHRNGCIQIDGKTRWVRATTSLRKDEATGDIIAVISVADDIHDVVEKERALRAKAELDPLTGLYNKKATEKYIKRHLAEQKTGVLFMVDLDNFKAINDNFGHTYGDEVLKEVCNILLGSFRNDDIVGRVGGDEFMVFVKNCTNPFEITRMAEKIRKQLHKTYMQNGIEIVISCSIGIALAENTGKSFAQLYSEADIAMYACKNENKNGFAFYEPTQNQG